MLLSRACGPVAANSLVVPSLMVCSVIAGFCKRLRPLLDERSFIFCPSVFNVVITACLRAFHLLYRQLVEEGKNRCRLTIECERVSADERAASARRRSPWAAHYNLTTQRLRVVLSGLAYKSEMAVAFKHLRHACRAVELYPRMHALVATTVKTSLVASIRGYTSKLGSSIQCTVSTYMHVDFRWSNVH